MAAYAWYAKSADQGYAKAQYNLALLLEHGRGTAPDSQSARGWFMQAAVGGNADAVDRLLRYAEEGDLESQAQVGRMYYLGHGLPRDLREAFGWTRKAAEQGHVAAAFSLGVMYEKGQGHPQSYQDAASWYQRA